MFDIIALFIISAVLFAAPIALFPKVNWLSVKKKAEEQKLTFKEVLGTGEGQWCVWTTVLCWAFAIAIFFWNLGTI